MDLKKRLIISNTVTAIIPIIITIITAFIFMFVSLKLFNKDITYKSFKELATVKSELFDTISRISKQNPETIEDENFHKFLQQKLSSLNGEVILTRGSDIIFSTKEFSKIDIEKCLEAARNQNLERTVKINNSSYMVEASHIQLKDTTSGYAIVLAPMSQTTDSFKVFIIVIVLVFIISFIAANMFMSYLFSKRILKPVSLLKEAASQISSGNLKCEIIETGDAEIRELCHSFEMMRIQLKDSIRMKMKYDDNRTALVSSISHDLKTPITSIKGYVEGILDGVANTPEKLESYLKTIYSKAEQMDIMIDDLLLYSKLDLNQLPFNFEKTDIVEYFEFCIHECEPELQNANIKIELKNDLTKHKYVMLDRERIRRVIMNIIDNSRKYMDKKSGNIIINLRETNSSIIIEIRDNGVGINNADVNKIFDRFYRGDLARTGTKGSGLGLAIAKQIVEGHKGKIWAVGHANEGTSVIISLAKIVQE